MQTNFKLVATALIAASLATPAMANESYVAVDVGQTKAKDACSIAGLPAGTTISGCSETATAFRVAGGVQLAPAWAAEISYGAYGKASLGTLSVPGFGTFGPTDWKLSGLQLAAIGSLPLSNEFSLTGKLGLASTTISLPGASATSNNLAFGIGMQYSVTPNVALRAQYENLGTVGDNATTGTAKVSLLTAGLVFKF